MKIICLSCGVSVMVRIYFKLSFSNKGGIIEDLGLVEEIKGNACWVDGDYRLGLWLVVVVDGKYFGCVNKRLTKNLLTEIIKDNRMMWIGDNEKDPLKTINPNYYIKIRKINQKIPKDFNLIKTIEQVIDFKYRDRTYDYLMALDYNFSDLKVE